LDASKESFASIGEFWKLCSMVKMRHAQLIPIRRCSRVKVLQRLEKIMTGIQTAVPLMHNLAYPTCKEFHGLLPELLNHSLLQVVA
jgi:hypothetical protein